MNSDIQRVMKVKPVTQTIAKALLMLLGVIVTLIINANSSYAATTEDIDKNATQALNHLYAKNKVANELAKRAKAVLVFPNIIKAGLVFGGSYGEGVLIKNDAFVNYYNSVGGSWGFQAGAQSYGYAVLLMNDKAVKYLADSHGWEIGVGPTVVIFNEGAGKNLSSSTMKDDAYAFIFDQQGLMLGFSIEGTKISQIKE